MGTFAVPIVHSLKSTQHAPTALVPGDMHLVDGFASEREIS